MDLVRRLLLRRKVVCQEQQRGIPGVSFVLPMCCVRFKVQLAAAAVILLATLIFADERSIPHSPTQQHNQSFPTIFLCHQNGVEQSSSFGKRSDDVSSSTFNTTVRNDVGSRIRIVSPFGYISDGPGNYSSDMKCTWLLEAPNGGEIHLVVHEFATECNWDHLYIWDGNSVQSPLLGSFSGDLLEAFQRHDTAPSAVGGELPKLHLIARSGYALVHFYSDAAYSNTGFNISFRMCDKKNEQSCLSPSSSSRTSPSLTKADDDSRSISSNASISNNNMPKADSSNLDNSLLLPVSSSVFGCSNFFPCHNGGACHASSGECLCPFNITETESSTQANDHHDISGRKYPWGVDCSLRGYWSSVFAPEPTSGWIELPSRNGPVSPFALNAAMPPADLRRASTSASILSTARSQQHASAGASSSGNSAVIDSAPPPSASLAVAQRDHEVILIPGETFTKLKPLSRIYKFNLDTGRWRTLDSQTRNNPDSRYGHSAVWYERQNGIYIYGGVVNGTKVISELWLWASDLDMFVLVETRSCAAPMPSPSISSPSAQSTTAAGSSDKPLADNRPDLVKKEPIGKVRSSDGGNFVMPKTRADDDEVSVSKLPSSRTSSTAASASKQLQQKSSSSSANESSLHDAILALRRSAISGTAGGDAFTVQFLTQLLAASRGAGGSKLNTGAGEASSSLGYMSECAQPIPATGHTAHIVDDKMMIFFGYGGSEHGLLPYVQEFDLATRMWRIIRPLGAIVKGTYGHASLYDPLTKLVYISGGAVQMSVRVSSVTQRLLSYDPSTHVMTILKASPSARVLHAGVATGDGLLLFFGGNPHNSGGNMCYSDSVWAYDTTCNAWSRVNSTTPYFTGVGTVARYGHAAVWYKRQAYLFGGFRGFLLNDVVRFSPPSCAAFGDAAASLALDAVSLCRNSVKFGAKCFYDSHSKSCLPASVLVQAHGEAVAVSSTPSISRKSRTDSSTDNVANLDNELEHLPHTAEAATASAAADSCIALMSNSANSGAAGAAVVAGTVKLDLFDAKSECERMENCQNCLANKFGCHWCPMASRCTTLPCRMYTPIDAGAAGGASAASGSSAVAIALAAGGSTKASAGVVGGDAVTHVTFPNSTTGINAVIAAGASDAGQQRTAVSTPPVTPNTEITSPEMCPSGIADRCRLQSVCAACNADSNQPLCVWSAAGKTTNLCTPRSPSVDAWHLLSKLSDKPFATKTSGAGGGIQQRLVPGTKNGRLQPSSKSTSSSFGWVIGPIMQDVPAGVVGNTSILTPGNGNGTKQATSAHALNTVDATIMEHLEQAAEQIILTTASVALECDTPCDARSNCAECVMHASSCMWCASEQRCLDSSMYSMTFPYGQCKEWSTMLKKCDTMLRCEQLRSCDTCLANPECGWCDDGSFTGLGTCQSGSTLAPHNVSQCPSSRWHFVTCPKCNCNGHSVCIVGEGNVCGRCANHTAGPQCDTCEAGYFGDPRNGGDCKQCDCPADLSNGCDSSTGACSCVVKGLKGHRCDRCDDHYVGDPQSNDTSLDATCFYRLANGFQFTFNMSKPEDTSYRQLNMANFPNDLDLDLRFAIACSNYSIVNVTVRSLASEQDAVLIENLECSNFTENERIFTSTSNYPIGDKNTTFLVWIHMYNMPLVVKVSFVQVPALDLIQFFLVFSVCFIILLVFVGAGYKIKQRYDFYRRRQRMVVELEALAKRPYPAAYLELTAPRALAATSHLYQPLSSSSAAATNTAITTTAQVEQHSPTRISPAVNPTTSTSGSTGGGLLRGRFARKPAVTAAAVVAANTPPTLPDTVPLPTYPKYIQDAFSLVITKEAAAAAQIKSKAVSAAVPNNGTTTAASSSSSSGEVTTKSTNALVPKHVVPLSLEPFGAAGDKHAVLSVVILMPHDPNTGYTPRDAAPFAIGTTICSLSSGATRKALFSSHLPKPGNNGSSSGAGSGVRFFKRRPRSQQPPRRSSGRTPAASSATTATTTTVAINVARTTSLEHRNSVSEQQQRSSNNNDNIHTTVRHVTVSNSNNSNRTSNDTSDTVIDIVPGASTSRNAVRQLRSVTGSLSSSTQA